MTPITSEFPRSNQRAAAASLTKVFLYSDQPITAAGLKTVLAATGLFELHTFFSGIGELVTRLKSEVPGVVVLDMPAEDVFNAVTDIQRVAPSAKVVLWVNGIATEMAFQAMGLGVRGILRKSLAVDLHVKCLQKVNGGELWFEKGLTDHLLAAKRIALSPREGQLVTLLAHGMKNKEIAYLLRITEGTVKVYLSRLFDKVGVKDRFELALFGLKNIASDQLQISETPGSQAVVPSLRSMMLERPTNLRPQ